MSEWAGQRVEGKRKEVKQAPDTSQTHTVGRPVDCGGGPPGRKVIVWQYLVGGDRHHSMQTVKDESEENEEIKYQDSMK